MLKIKLKNKSSVKKRIRLTATNKLKVSQSNKKHNMLKRSKRQIRNQRGYSILNSLKQNKIKLYLPYL